MSPCCAAGGDFRHAAVAVTHVLVNSPDTGYGVFIENMLEAAG
ncbi:MAG: hypothetical protein E7428_05580 [Ruminococcaceae bacterium]|nr:hypothetical protein [Oscillospiraceae bacterium]